MNSYENLTDNEIESFILKVFNYYNGKINLFNNNAKLNINWANMMDTSIGGYSIYPNIVIIYPRIIYRYSQDIEDFKMTVVEVIIHELTHTDQIIDYDLYDSNKEYTDYIEYACQLQAQLYILSNTNDIYNKFGIRINLNKKQQEEIIRFWYYPGVYYNRRKYVDHICMLIYFLYPICDKNKIYEIISSIQNNDKNLIITINNNEIVVKNEYGFVNLNQFNDFASKFICTSTYTPSMEVYDIGYAYYIKIDLDVKNEMCLLK